MLFNNELRKKQAPENITGTAVQNIASVRRG